MAEEGVVPPVAVAPLAVVFVPAEVTEAPAQGPSVEQVFSRAE